MVVGEPLAGSLAPTLFPRPPVATDTNVLFSAPGAHAGAHVLFSAPGAHAGAPLR